VGGGNGSRLVITRRRLEQGIRDNTLDGTAGELAEEVPTLTPDQTLEDALATLLRADSGLPVAAADATTPVGWLTHLDVLRAYDTNGR